MTKIRQLLWVIFSAIYIFILRKIYGMEIGKGGYISYKAHLDKSVNPKGIHIGNNSQILAGAIVFSHDDCRDIKADVYIGDNCFISVNAIILPGVRVGNQVVVGAGSVVTKDVPDCCIVAGNPARIIRRNIRVNDKGVIVDKGIRED